MPAPFPDRAAVIARILDRVAAGERLKPLCRQPGMPSYEAVYGWTRRDRALDEALAAAMRQGRLVRGDTFDEARAQALLDRLRAGETLQQLTRHPCPPMPNAGRLELWRTLRPDFDEQLRRVLAAARVQRGHATAARLRPAYRPFTQAEGDRVLVRVGRGEPLASLAEADPTLPPAWLVRLWRREAPEFAADLAANIRAGRIHRARAGARRRRQALVDRLVVAIIEGASFNDLGGRDGFPGRRTLGRWVRQDAEFARRIAQACHDREEGLIELAQMAIGEGPMTLKALRQRLGPINRRAASLRVRPGIRRKPRKPQADA